METQDRHAHQEPIFCRECRTGIMKQENVTYYTWTIQDLITVPDFPAWVCDVCGHREFDMNALYNLNIMLRSNMPNQAKLTRTKKPPLNEKPTPPTQQPE